MTTNNITKISLKKGKPTIAGNRTYPGGAVEEFTIQGHEVADGIIAAMSGLTDTLINACCLADDWDKSDITGLTVKPVEHDYGIVITGQLRVEDDVAYVVVVNSPYLSPDRLTSSEQMAVKRILAAAVDYLESLPEQLELAVAA